MIRLGRFLVKTVRSQRLKLETLTERNSLKSSKHLSPFPGKDFNLNSV